MASSRELAKQIEETILSQLRNGDITRDQALDRASDLDYEGADQTESSVRSEIYSASIASDPNYSVDKARSDVTSDSKIIDSDVPAARANIYQAAVQSAKVALDEALTLIRNDQHLSQEISDATERNVIKADFVGGSKDLSETVNRISNSNAFSDKKKAVREVLDYARDNNLLSGENYNDYIRDIDSFIVNAINDDVRVNTSNETVSIPNISPGRVLGANTVSANNVNNNQETVVNIDHYNTQGGNMNLTQILAGIADDNASIIRALSELKSSNEIANKEDGYKKIVSRARELDYINNDLWRIFMDNMGGFLSQEYDTRDFVSSIRNMYYRDSDPLRAEGGSNNIAASQGVGVGALDEVSILETEGGTSGSIGDSANNTSTSNSQDAQAIINGVENGDYDRNQATILINKLTGVTEQERDNLHNAAQAIFNGTSTTTATTATGTSGSPVAGSSAPGTAPGTQLTTRTGSQPTKKDNMTTDEILDLYDAGGLNANELVDAVNSSSAITDKQQTLSDVLAYAAANVPGSPSSPPFDGTFRSGTPRPDNLSPTNTQQTTNEPGNVQLNIHDTGVPTQYVGRSFSDGRADIVGGITAQPTGLQPLEDLRPDLYPHGFISYSATPPADPWSKGPDGIWGGPGATPNFGLTPQDSLMMHWNSPISSGAGIQLDPATGKYLRFGDLEATKVMIANQFAKGDPNLAQQIYNDLVDPGSIGPQGLAHGAVGAGWFDIHNEQIHGLSDAAQGSYQGSPLIYQGSGKGAAGLAVYGLRGEKLPERLTAQDKNIQAKVDAYLAARGIGPGGAGSQVPGGVAPIGGPGTGSSYGYGASNYATNLVNYSTVANPNSNTTGTAVDATGNPLPAGSTARPAFNFYNPDTGTMINSNQPGSSWNKPEHQGEVFTYATPRSDGKLPTADDMAVSDRARFHNSVYKLNHSDVTPDALVQLLALRQQYYRDLQLDSLGIHPDGLASSVQYDHRIKELDRIIAAEGLDKVHNVLGLAPPTAEQRAVGSTAGPLRAAATPNPVENGLFPGSPQALAYAQGQPFLGDDQKYALPAQLGNQAPTAESGAGSVVPAATETGRVAADAATVTGADAGIGGTAGRPANPTAGSELTRVSAIRPSTNPPQPTITQEAFQRIQSRFSPTVNQPVVPKASADVLSKPKSATTTIATPVVNTSNTWARTATPVSEPRPVTPVTSPVASGPSASDQEILNAIVANRNSWTAPSTPPPAGGSLASVPATTAPRVIAPPPTPTFMSPTNAYAAADAALANTRVNYGWDGGLNPDLFGPQ